MCRVTSAVKASGSGPIALEIISKGTYAEELPGHQTSSETRHTYSSDCVLPLTPTLTLVFDL